MVLSVIIKRDNGLAHTSAHTSAGHYSDFAAFAAAADPF